MAGANHESIHAAAAPSESEDHGRPGRFAAVRSHPGIAVGAIIVSIVVLVALLAPFISPYDPYAIHPIDRLKGIGSPGYLLGTDIQGRDMLSRLAWGSRTSLAIAVVPLAIAGLIGLLLGSFAAYGGGISETLIMRGMDVVFGLPPILLAIAVAATLGPGLFNLLVSLTIVLIPPMTRVTAQVVAILREQTFVEAARASGARDLPDHLPSHPSEQRGPGARIRDFARRGNGGLRGRDQLHSASASSLRRPTGDA